jgi:hypothetical protein
LDSPAVWYFYKFSQVWFQLSVVCELVAQTFIHRGLFDTDCGVFRMSLLESPKI